MTQKRQTALQLTLLAIAMAALVVLSVVGPAACTPSAPAGQASGQVEEEATATPTTAATNTPNVTATPEATSTATLAPTATVAPANSKVEPMLNALVAQSQSAGAQGAAGQTLRMVGVVIDPVGTTDSVSNANWETVRQLVTDNGGTILGGREYSVPVSLLPQLAVHTAVATIIADRPKDFPYPRMSRALNNVIAVWQSGATPQQAAAAYSPLVYDDKILAFIDVADESALSRVGEFFTVNKVYVAPERRESDLTELSMMVLVPVHLLASLSQVSGVTEVEDFGEAPVTSGESISPEDKEYLNLFLYGTLPPNLRSQLSPLPTEVWELEGITPTPTPAPTSAPTPDVTATPEATSTVTPAPTATVAPAANKVEPMLNALVTQSQSAGAQGAAGQTVRMVGVVIDPAGATQSVFLANSDAIDRLVTDNGGTNMGTGEYSVPVSLLSQLASHSAVASVTAAWPEDFLYPKMSRALNNAVAAWQAGATPQQAAAAYSALVYDDKILAFIDVADAAAFNRVEAFFTTNKVYVAPEGRESDLTELSMMVLVPVPLLASLAQVSGITEIEDSGLEPVSVGASRSPEFQEYLNLFLYGTLPPNLRSQLSPLPTEVWELEGITPTPTPAPTSAPTPAPSSGLVSGAAATTGNPGGTQTPAPAHSP